MPWNSLSLQTNKISACDLFFFKRQSLAVSTLSAKLTLMSCRLHLLVNLSASVSAVIADYNHTKDDVKIHGSHHTKTVGI